MTNTSTVGRFLENTDNSWNAMPSVVFSVLSYIFSLSTSTAHINTRSCEHGRAPFSTTSTIPQRLIVGFNRKLTCDHILLQGDEYYHRVQ